MIKHRRLKLSAKREAWAENRDTTLRSKPLRINARYQQRQVELVQAEIDKMAKDVSREVKKLFGSNLGKETFAQDASLASQARMLMNRISRQWTRRFNLFTDDWASAAMGGIDKMAGRDLGESMEALTGGMTIKTDSLSDTTKDILTASTNQAASLIKSIPQDYLSDVSEGLMRSITMPESNFAKTQTELHKMLTGRFKRYRNKAKNLVLDQTKKTYEALNSQRMREIGVTQYIWRHAGGSQEPRHLHKYVLNGKTFDLDDPPIIDEKTGERGEPGQTYYCSCYKEPVITFGNKKL